MINSGREWDWMTENKKQMTEEELLKKLYEYQETLDWIHENGDINQKYSLVELLIEQIEKHLSNEKGII